MFLIAQRPGDWGDIVVLAVVVVVSVIGSLGKWIAGQLSERRKRETQLRGGLRPPAVSAPLPRQVLETAKPLLPQTVGSEKIAPPFAGPVPPVLRRVVKRMETSSGDEPVMGRVLEMLLEQATGRKIEHHTPPPAPQPPPAPAASPRPVVRRSQPAGPRVAPLAPSTARPMSIEEREQLKARQLTQRQTRAETESEEMVSRETRFIRESDKRMGQVATHVAAPAREDARPEPAVQTNPLERTSLRDAFILSEILAPPLALRDVL